MKTVHWLGAGLSSRPGFERLKARRETALVLWSRNQSKAASWLAAGTEFRIFSLAALESSLSPGDCVVSMLPASMHPEIARACLKKHAHLVTSSYLSQEMRALAPEAARLGLIFLNELGLDPGIDHLFAHSLVAEIESLRPAGSRLELSLISVCGGFPAEPDDFRYRFSWSPLGVLKALCHESRWLENGQQKMAASPAMAVREYAFGSETLEMYPNRDSFPYVQEYGLERLGQVTTFVRGTLRPHGWAKAWAGILPRLKAMPESELAALAGDLADRFLYGPLEHDRVCLDVRVFARDSQTGWQIERSLSLDEVGTPEAGTAMARTVSLTTAIGVEAVLSGKMPPGVWGCPSEPEWVNYWLEALSQAGIGISRDS